jgi:hypothetical protein
MWLSKMTRTGLLFPGESFFANEGFSGFGGGPSSSSTSRRGSASSVSSVASFGGVSVAGSTASSAFDGGNQNPGDVGSASQYINHHGFMASREERHRQSGPALMVLTHPELETWHRDAIREATGKYGIGIIFVPLFKIDVENDEENDGLPVLRPLDLSTVSGFASFDALRAAAGQQLKYGKGKEGTLEEEMVLKVDVEGSIEHIIEELVGGVRDVMFS